MITRWHAISNDGDNYGRLRSEVEVDIAKRRREAVASLQPARSPIKLESATATGGSAAVRSTNCP